MLLTDWNFDFNPLQLLTKIFIVFVSNLLLSFSLLSHGNVLLTLIFEYIFTLITLLLFSLDIKCFLSFSLRFSSASLTLLSLFSRIFLTLLPSSSFLSLLAPSPPPGELLPSRHCPLECSWSASNRFLSSGDLGAVAGNPRFLATFLGTVQESGCLTTDPAVPLHRASWAPQLEKPYSQPSDSLGSRAEDEASWGLGACRSLGRIGILASQLLELELLTDSHTAPLFSGIGLCPLRHLQLRLFSRLFWVLLSSSMVNITFIWH